MHEVARLIELLHQKAKLVAMLAPSFPIVYAYPEIISQLKQLGFTYFTEVAAGAKKTNEQVLKLLQDDPHTRIITSPCASFARLVSARYPRLLPFLTFQADSPMVATAKIVKEKYPACQLVFIGPCVAKKFESSEDHPELDILVLTYKELEVVLKEFNIKAASLRANDVFDLMEPSTRIYPYDGGLTQTSGVRAVLKDDEIRIVSGWKNCEAALSEFEKNPRIRLLDILFCEGGCINGPGIVSGLTLEERKKKIDEFAGQKS